MKRTHKKGMIALAEKQIYFMTGITLLLLLFVGIITAWAADIKSESTPTEFKKQTNEMRLLYSPRCFAYVDDSGRTFPGIIDMEKVTHIRLERCISHPDITDSALRLRIVKGDGQELADLQTNTWFSHPVKSDDRRIYPIKINGHGEGLIFIYHYQKT